MKNRKSIVLGGVVILLCGVALAQPPAPPAAPPVGFGGLGPLGVAPPAAGNSGVVPATSQPPIPSVAPAPPVKPDDMTIEQLAAALESVAAQEAVLAKQKQDLTVAVQKKMAAMKSRLDKVGVGAPSDNLPPANVPIKPAGGTP